jgi:hypothetical protein
MTRILMDCSCFRPKHKTTRSPPGGTSHPLEKLTPTILLKSLRFGDFWASGVPNKPRKIRCHHGISYHYYNVRSHVNDQTHGVSAHVTNQDQNLTPSIFINYLHDYLGFPCAKWLGRKLSLSHRWPNTDPKKIAGLSSTAE